MQARLDLAKTAPGVVDAMRGLETYLRSTGLEAGLLDLVRVRVSIINGCAYCLDMHTKDARAAGETEQRLYAIPVWRETPFFTERERAALAWAEAVTNVAYDHVPAAEFEAVRKQFSDKEVADLTLATVAINGWNRVAIAFRAVPGTYQVEKRKAVGSAGPQPGDA